MEKQYHNLGKIANHDATELVNTKGLKQVDRTYIHFKVGNNSLVLYNGSKKIKEWKGKKAILRLSQHLLKKYKQELRQDIEVI